MNAEDVATFERCIAVGGVALFPADTVYGLATEPDTRTGVERLYEIKGRPPRRPAAVMFFQLEEALAALSGLGARTRAALERLLPGPVTLLLPNPERRFPLACGPSPERLGLRVPEVPLLARGERREDIAASVHRAVAARTLGLVAQVGRHTPVVMTGGVAKNAAAVHFVAQALDVPVSVPDMPQITGAFGGALLARESFRGHQIEADDRAGTHRAAPPPDCATCDAAHTGMAPGPDDRPLIPVRPR